VPRRSTVAQVLPPFLAGKGLVLLVALLTAWTRNTHPGLPGYAEVVQPFGAWDGESYRSIAQHGYPSGPLDLNPGGSGHVWAFLPGFPMLVRAVMVLVPDSTTAGMLVAAVCELIALVYLAKLLQLERPGDADSSRFTVWLLVLYPYAMFLTAVYTESPFLAAATASLYYMRSGDHVRASVLAGLSSVVRITGLALIPALLVEYAIRHRTRARPDVLAALLPALPLLLFVLYAHAMTGDGLALWHVEASASFNRITTWPWSGLIETARAAQNNAGNTSLFFSAEVVLGVAFLAAIAYMAVSWRRYAPSLTVYSAATWVLSCSFVYWLGVQRYMIAIVPAFIAAADMTRNRPELRVALLTVSAGCLAFFTVLLASGVFVA
jgi:Gpi18-like mannosyltransferase